MPWTEQWSVKFQTEQNKLKQLIGDNLLSIHHIGSTSVKGMLAKPIIDILVVVQSLQELDVIENGFKETGYIPKGENGITGRRYYQLVESGERNAHVHCFESGDSHVVEHLCFAEVLNTDQKLASQYAQLKTSLAERFKDNPAKYSAGKTEMIEKILKDLAV